MPNSLTIVPNGTRPKVIETGNYIIIMDQMYNKQDLTCIDKKTCTFDNIIAGNNILNICTHMYLTGSLDLSYNADRHKRKVVWQDKYNPNRYYLIINEHYSNQSSPGSYLVCVEENNDDINLIYKIKYSAEIKEILDESNTMLYIWGVSQYSAEPRTGMSAYTSWRGQTSVYEVDKTTGSSIKTLSDAWSTYTCKNNYGNPWEIPKVSRVNILYKDDEKFVYRINYNGAVSTGSSTKYYINVYNKQSRSFDKQDLKSYHLADNNSNQSAQTNLLNHNEEYQNIFETNDNKYWWTYFKVPTGMYRYMHYYNPNDNTNDIVEVFDEDITLSYPQSFHNLSINWIVDNYLYILIYNGAESSLGNAQKLYIYQCNENYTNAQEIFVYYNQQSFNNIIRSMVYNSDKTILLIGYDLAFEIFILNQETHMYETSGKVLNNIVSAGFDETDRLWYQDANGAVYAENLDDPLTVVPEFEKIYYTYSNTNINTYLKFSAKSFTKKPALGKYILTLSDNAYFVETNDQILEINYTGDDTIHYPLVITGPKKVSCSTVFEKVW